jgi:TorA maturation chaperone TorD
VNVNISQQLVDYEQARSNCYKLLAACFYQPQKEAFIQEEFFKNLAMVLKDVSPDAAAHVPAMEKAFLNYSNEDLLIDYAKLFVGPNELIAPPYGSVYMDDGRRTMGDSTLEAIKIYKDEGLAIDENFKELPDHIAVELEFMYYLIFKETEALEKSETDKALDFIKTQELFLYKFLARWVKPFCDKIKAGTDNEFYNSLADCLSVFIEKARAGEDISEALKASPV